MFFVNFNFYYLGELINMFNLIRHYFILVVIIFISFGCTNTSSKMTSQAEINKEKSLIGTYKGFLPCASCPGIIVILRLKEDHTFERIDFYMGDKGSNFKEKGTFLFLKDLKRVVLTSEDGLKLMYSFKNGQLIMLNSEGKKSSSKLKEMYKLKKVIDRNLN